MANELKLASKVVFLNGIPLTLPKAAVDPSSAVAGDMYFNSTSNAVKIYDGSLWQPMTTGIISLTGQTLATGSTLVGVSGSSTAVDTVSQGDILASSSGLSLKSNVITNAEVNASAAIAYSKLNLSGSVIGSDVSSAANLSVASVGTSGNVSASGTVSGSNLTSAGHASADLLKANNLNDVVNPQSSFDNISGMTLLGDLIYGGSAGTRTILHSDTSNTRKFLRTQSISSVGQAPIWDTLQASDLPSSITSNTSGTAANVTGIVAVANGGSGANTASVARQNLGTETVFSGIENNALFAVSYDATTREFTVTYSAGAAITVGGVRYTKSGSDTTTAHANVSSLYFCYYDINGVIQVSSTPWNLLVTAPIATVYYNADSVAGILSNELHPGDTGMGEAAHLNLHTTRGTQILSGIQVSGYTLNTSGLINTSYALSAGSIADEDLVLSTASQQQGGAHTYRVIYQTGASGSPEWNWVDDAEGGIYSNGTNIYYNQLNAGTWQLTPITGTQWVNYWVLATTAYSAPQLVMVMGQNTYASLASAQAASFASDVSNIGLFTAEGVAVYQMTYAHDSSFGAPGNIQLASVTRVTTSIVTVATGVGTVVSVALSDNTGLFNIAGSPITSAGTLTLQSLQSKAQNSVFAGPASGGAGAPSFRALIASDLPSLSGTYVTQAEVGFPNGVAALDTNGKVPVAQLPNSVMEYQQLWNPITNTPTLADGTGVNGNVYRSTSAFAGPISGLTDTSMVNIEVGDMIIFSSTAAKWQKSPTADLGGTVTSVGLVDSTGLFTVTNSPVTGAGSLTLSAFASQSQATFLAGPVSGSGASAFRSIAATDIPTLNQSTTGTAANVTGTVALGHGGTGIAAGSANAAFAALSPMTAAGDIIYENATPVPARLAIGSSGQILTVVSGAPAWASPSVSPGAISLAQNHILIGNASNLAADVAMSGDATILASGVITIGSGAITATKLGTVADGVTLDQSGTGSTLEVKTGGISNAQINTSAAIAYSKLNLSGSILNADINSSAAIAYSKLNLSGSILNADINSSAAIAYSKLAALTANIIPTTNASGFLQSSSSSAETLVSSAFNRGLNTTNVVSEIYLDSITLSDNQSSPVAVTAFQFAIASFAGEEISYVIETGTASVDTRVGTVRVTCSNGGAPVVSLSDMFTESADCGAIWSASVSSGTVSVLYTTTSQGSARTMRADVKQFRR